MIPRDTTRAIEETSIIRLSLEDQQNFINLLINPPEPTPALLLAAKAHTKLIQN